MQAVLPVKRAATYTLCVFIRYNRRQERRNELISWIIEREQIRATWPLYCTLLFSLAELAKGQSCRRRLLFLDMCPDLIELFSRTFFKKHFFDSILELAHVRVWYHTTSM